MADRTTAEQRMASEWGGDSILDPYATAWGWTTPSMERLAQALAAPSAPQGGPDVAAIESLVGEARAALDATIDRDRRLCDARLALDTALEMLDGPAASPPHGERPETAALQAAAHCDGAREALAKVKRGRTVDDVAQDYAVGPECFGGEDYPSDRESVDAMVDFVRAEIEVEDKTISESALLAGVDVEASVLAGAALSYACAVEEVDAEVGESEDTRRTWAALAKAAKAFAGSRATRPPAYVPKVGDWVMVPGVVSSVEPGSPVVIVDIQDDRGHIEDVCLTSSSLRPKSDVPLRAAMTETARRIADLEGGHG